MVREQQERHREAQQMDRLREARTSTTCKLQSEGWFEEEIVPFWLLAVLFGVIIYSFQTCLPPAFGYPASK